MCISGVGSLPLRNGDSLIFSSSSKCRKLVLNRKFFHVRCSLRLPCLGQALDIGAATLFFNACSEHTMCISSVGSFLVQSGGTLVYF